MTEYQQCILEAFLTACDENPERDGAGAADVMRVMTSLGTLRAGETMATMARQMADMGSDLQRPVRSVWPAGIIP